MTIFCSTDLDPTDLVAKYLGGMGIKVPLQYGDFLFEAKGWGGQPVSVSVERKRLRDLINSLVLSKRLVQQLRDARTAHQVLYLIVEGLYREGDSGVIEVRKAGGWVPLNCGTPQRSIYISYTRLESSLDSLENVDGVHIRRTTDPKGTAKELIRLYHWWQTAPEAHTTTQAFYSGPVPLAGKLPIVRRMAKELPGVGWELSSRVAARFATVREMVNAQMDEWKTVDGIGEKTAQEIDMALGGKGL